MSSDKDKLIIVDKNGDFNTIHKDKINWVEESGQVDKNVFDKLKSKSAILLFSGNRKSKSWISKFLNLKK
jgi:hypothetical protein